MPSYVIINNCNDHLDDYGLQILLLLNVVNC